MGLTAIWLACSEMAGVTCDTGALIAAQRSSRHMRALHQRLLGRGGSADHASRNPGSAMARWDSASDVEDVACMPRRAPWQCPGSLRWFRLRNCRHGRRNDASVVVVAASRDDLIVISDENDMRPIRGTLGLKSKVRGI